ncbi:MotA/TolQ/ExbB proton channel family protein [Candidatus Mycalebacterium sp.]
METIFEIMGKTGFFFYPIALCSIVGTTLFIEKFYFLRESKVVPPETGQFLSLLEKKEFNGVRVLCEANNSPSARVTLVAIEAAAENKDPEEFARRSLENESLDLYSHIEMLGAISSVSTLLGLLGTISGMIKIFGVISLDTDVNPAALAGGISEALYTTALGLCVAIPVFIAHKYLLGKYESVILHLEQSLKDIVTSLKKSSGDLKQ